MMLREQEKSKIPTPAWGGAFQPRVGSTSLSGAVLLLLMEKESEELRQHPAMVTLRVSILPLGS